MIIGGRLSASQFYPLSGASRQRSDSWPAVLPHHRRNLEGGAAAQAGAVVGMKEEIVTAAVAEDRFMSRPAPRGRCRRDYQGAAAFGHRRARLVDVRPCYLASPA